MLFDSSIRRELARSFGATLVVLTTIVLTMMLIRTLGQAAKGVVSPQDVMLLMGYTGLGHLPTILNLSLFIAVIGTLSRMYRDSEMVIWFAGGVGLARFVRPVFRLAWPLLAIIVLMALFVWPWSNERIAELRDRFEHRSDIARVAPGQFQESAGGSRVFFIERETQDERSGKNVFILSNEQGRESVTSARSGRIEPIGDDRFLLLDQGQRVDMGLANGSRKLSEFESYGVKVGEKDRIRADAPPARATRTVDLVRQPTPINRGELTWRIGLALGAVNLLLMAVALATVNPRAGRSWSLMFGLLAFIAYFNLVSLSQAWVASGKLGMGPVLAGVHGGTMLFALLVLAWRHAGWGLRWGGRRRAATLPAATLPEQAPGPSKDAP